MQLLYSNLVILDIVSDIGVGMEGQPINFLDPPT